MTKIQIKGVIVSNDYKEVYDWYGMESVSPNDVANALPSDASPVEVIINSPGGHVDAGSEIYTILKEYQGQVTTKIVGAAASAASVVAMAGDEGKVLIAPTGYMMIHNAANYAQGDQHAMRHNANMLEVISTGIANAYILKTGKTREELAKLMDEETFFNAQSAAAHGFVDEIMFDTEIPVLTNSIDSVLLPQSVIDKAREMKNKSGNDMTNIQISDKQIDSIVAKVTANLQMNINQTNEPTPVAKKRGFIF
ncbi:MULTISPECIES: head maturation protease, ClpP-related [unclassified Bacillus (in: firmicutes)]|uniref:head maturation protease, ClpP-related n=1 Tax=unclassified Bacillus (in: firmicutes) TaxID=185979 RepID=UPI001BE98762|nr:MULTISPECIES: head maturation protease, ClpP-related [unclassified Bacillus (in: firmicutes)]MBT2615121.1 Clp protease ClpP [Bacillus sp. ISL-78]MBT2628266.1 Clp protease ClpP [Bacillus sp. ISL-101]